MISGEGFISGCWVGGLLGAALMLTVISLCFAARPENQRIADEEQLEALRKRGW